MTCWFQSTPLKQRQTHEFLFENHFTNFTSMRKRHKVITWPLSFISVIGTDMHHKPQVVSQQKSRQILIDQRQLLSNIRKSMTSLTIAHDLMRWCMLSRSEFQQTTLLSLLLFTDRLARLIFRLYSLRLRHALLLIMDLLMTAKTAQNGERK